jgi:hypothetical protein
MPKGEAASNGNDVAPIAVCVKFKIDSELLLEQKG